MNEARVRKLADAMFDPVLAAAKRGAREPLEAFDMLGALAILNGRVVALLRENLCEKCATDALAAYDDMRASAIVQAIHAIKCKPPCE